MVARPGQMQAPPMGGDGAPRQSPPVARPGSVQPQEQQQTTMSSGQPMSQGSPMPDGQQMQQGGGVLFP